VQTPAKASLRVAGDRLEFKPSPFHAAWLRLEVAIAPEKRRACGTLVPQALEEERNMKSSLLL
jgi:hypothetical protein